LGGKFKTAVNFWQSSGLLYLCAGTFFDDLAGERCVTT
jgi:hypothetical protein